MRGRVRVDSSPRPSHIRTPVFVGYHRFCLLFSYVLVYCSAFTAVAQFLFGPLPYLPLPRTAFLCVLILAATQLISSDLPSVARLLRFPDPGSSFLNGYSSPAAGAAHRDIASTNRRMSSAGTRLGAGVHRKEVKP
jgi:hypothetical protein